MNANDHSVSGKPVVVQTLLGAEVLHVPQSQGLAYCLVSSLDYNTWLLTLIFRQSWYLKIGIHMQI